MAKNMYDIEDLSMQPSTDMEWFTHAIFGGKLIERGKITPVMGVKDETLINLIDLNGGILQADKGDCGWTPDELFKLAEKPLKVKTYKINFEQCLDDLERKRIIWALSPGAKNTELPDSLERASMELLAVELSNEIETKIFNGDKSKNANDFDGMATILIGSANSIKVQGVALNKDNVLGEIEKVFSRIPEDVQTKGLEGGNLNIFMPFSTLLKVKMALANVYGSNVVINPNFTVEGDTVKFMGVELVAVKGLSDGQMIAIDVRNSLLGTDLLSDTENVRLGQFPAPNDSKIFIDGRLRLGFVIPFEDEAVIYDPTVTTTPLRAPLSVPTVFQGTADEVIAYVKTVEDLNELKALLDAENVGKKRSTVIQAINARVDEISNV